MGQKMMSKISCVWVSLIICTVVFLILCFNSLSDEKSVLSRNPRPSYARYQVASGPKLGRNLKSGSASTEKYQEERNETGNLLPKQEIIVQNKKDKKEVNKTKLNKFKKHLGPKKSISKESDIRKSKLQSRSRYSIKDYNGKEDSPPVRFGVNQTLGRLNYEFSSHPDSFKANSKKFRIPVYRESEANTMTITGNLKVGQTVPDHSARHVLILTTWRSGSTFLGDLLNHYPGTFYYFEPLHYYERATDQRKSLPYTDLQFLKSLYKCNFNVNRGFLEHIRKPENKFLFKNHNFRLWNSCSSILPKEAMCTEPVYLNAVCPLFPIKLIKTVRLRMNHVRDLLTDPSLDLKIVLLVRDPRGVYNSRSSGTVSKWCNKEDCADPQTGCSDLMQDYQEAMELKTSSPGLVTLVRYEDLSLFPEETTQRLLKFLDLPWNPSMEEYIKTHTSSTKTNLVRNKATHKLERHVDIYGTQRNSSATAFAWMKQMDFTKISNIQASCSEPMKMFGYEIFSQEDDLKASSMPLLKTAEEIWPFN